MDLMSGADLFDRLHEGGVLTEGEAARMARSLLLAVSKKFLTLTVTS